MIEIEKILGERCTVGQCREIAKRLGCDSTTFDLCGPTGRKKAKWLDAYLGLFTVEGGTGFMRASDVELLRDLWCENVTCTCLCTRKGNVVR